MRAIGLKANIGLLLVILLLSFRIEANPITVMYGPTGLITSVYVDEVGLTDAERIAQYMPFQGATFQLNGFVTAPGYNPELTQVQIFDLDGTTSDFFEIAGFQSNNEIVFRFITTSPSQTGPLNNSGAAVIGSILETPGWHDLSVFFPRLPPIYFRGSVPEPNTLALLGFAIIGLGIARRKRAALLKARRRDSRLNR